jgi:hypothetical protein
MARLSILAVLALAGCASQEPLYVSTCPVSPVYTKSFEKSAAMQLKTLPDNSPLVKMISDYLAMRAEAKKCQNP